MIGAAIGSLTGGVFSDRYGWKPTIIIADIVFTLGALLMSLAGTLSLIMIGWFIVGLGVGAAAIVIPVYLSETAPKHLWGRIVTLNVLCITFGQFLSTLICLSLEDKWWWMLGLAGVPSFLQLLGMIFLMPETPRFNLKKGNEWEAINVLKKIYFH